MFHATIISFRSQLVEHQCQENEAHPNKSTLLKVTAGSAAHGIGHRGISLYHHCNAE